MPQKTCLVTGANAGIGKQACMQLAQAGCRVILGCRDSARGLAALAEVRSVAQGPAPELVTMDLSSQASLREAAARLLDLAPSLDVLIHNAADFDISRKKPLLTRENIESVWATNHLGPVLLTRLLLPALRQAPAARILTIASQGLVLFPWLRIRLSDPEFKTGRYSVEKAYYHSKLAQVMYTYWLAEQLRPAGITVNCIRVTNVKIDISRYPDLSPLMKKLYAWKSRFSISPAEMAVAYRRLALEEEFAGVTAAYYNEKCRSVASSPYSRNTATQAALMEVTDAYLK